MEANNMKAMRDALEELVSNIEMRASAFDIFSIIDRKTFLDAKAALAKPPRNCDVGTPSEQRARFDKFCRSNSWDEIDGAHCMSSCPLYHGDCSRCEELEWAQMPYEEG